MAGVPHAHRNGMNDCVVNGLSGVYHGVYRLCEVVRVTVEARPWWRSGGGP